MTWWKEGTIYDNSYEVEPITGLTINKMKYLNLQAGTFYIQHDHFLTKLSQRTEQMNYEPFLRSLFAQLCLTVVEVPLVQSQLSPVTQ